MNYTDDFIGYLNRATSPIQTADTVINRLEANGFQELTLKGSWKLERGGAYYVKAYPTTVFAFKIGESSQKEALKIITSHTDTPGFKVKPNPELPKKGYLMLNTELYCQPMFYSWFDRPLSMAGHVILRSENIFEPTVVPADLSELILTIPSLAIHMNRDINKSAAFNPQKDMLPLVSSLKKEMETDGWLLGYLAEHVGCKVDDILDYDLYVYVKESGIAIGKDRDLISAPRIDNQSSVYASIQSLIESNPQTGISLAACFDNEEIGSTTKQGADSMLLTQILKRISIALNMTEEEMYRMYDDSFYISADGAHALHPNAADKSDPTNEAVINRGIAIKLSAKQSYASDGISAGIFKSMCEANGLRYQYLVNRSDIPGGRTLGPLVSKYLPIKGVDVGLPMLAMHSARELCGAEDLKDMIAIFRFFYNY